MDRAGYTGKDNLNVGQQTVAGGRIAVLLIGANALTLDPQGRLVICAMTDRCLQSMSKKEKARLYAGVQLQYVEFKR